MHRKGHSRSTAPSLAARAALSLFCLACAASAQYTARREGDVIHLDDSSRQVRVSIAPAIGNLAFEMLVKGQNVLRFPHTDLEQFRSHPTLNGIPLLAPWANRLDEQAFYANGKKYVFNIDLGNIRGVHPIHGFVSFTGKWNVVKLEANRKSAWATSRLEFYREPSWMAQFPFAHTIEMTYRLSNGVLEVNLQLHNLSSEPMPVSIGFHPYFQLTDSPREAWTISLAAAKQWLLNSDKIPTGETAPITAMFPDPNRIALKDYSLDHVFGDLVRDADGRARMMVSGKAQQLEVFFGPKYNTAVVYSPSAPPSTGAAPATDPQSPNFVCFEPMAGITDAMNLAHRGLYHDLQMLPPDQVWQESFWIHPAGF